MKFQICSTAVFLLLAFPPIGWALGDSASAATTPEFNCDLVPYPDKAGAYASADPRPLQQVYAEERQHGFEKGTVYVVLSFDASGSVVNASIDRSVGNRNIDLAALKWAFCTKIKPGKSSTATIPVMFRW